MAVALAVVAGNRPQVVVAAPAALPQSTSTFTPGVFASGDATVSTKPDVAFLMVGVQSSKPTAAAVQSDLASKAARLIAKAKAIGIADKDISTSGYSVNPNYVGSNTTIDGYMASEQISLKWHNVDTAGNALDALVQSGGATNVSVGFGLADPKAAQAQARALAIADAKTKAQAMADAAGVRLGQVMRVSDISSYGGAPMLGYAAGSAAASVPTQIPVGPARRRGDGRGGLRDYLEGGEKSDGAAGDQDQAPGQVHVEPAAPKDAQTNLLVDDDGNDAHN
ncbi:MAG TPA: SIMPL domain-containing protein [Candidatus Acidoferrum sp.]|nr:SIMPL domain-containing protein [Candidatus Acidoferrum sp.]